MTGDKVERIKTYIEGTHGFLIESDEEEKELIRCKDCIHYRYCGLTEETVSECTIDHCENPYEEWFCADGKRKEVK